MSDFLKSEGCSNIDTFDVVGSVNDGIKLPFYLVGVAGFEPATSCSQSRRDDRATLHPEKVCANIALKKVNANSISAFFKLYFVLR